MLLTPPKLRADARRYMRASEEAVDFDSKSRFLEAAFALLQIAEYLDRDGLPAPDSRRLNRMLEGAVSEELRTQVAALLREDKAAGFGRRPIQVEAVRLLDDILAEALMVMGADMGNIQLADPASAALEIVTSKGFDAAFLDYFAVVKNGDCSCGSALAAAERIVVPNVETSLVFAGTESGRKLSDANVRAVQSTPIVGAAGRVIGVVNTHWPSARVPTSRQLDGLDALIKRSVPRLVAAMPVA